MSINLHCDQLDLLQTPTYITNMCMSINPETNEPDGGMDGVRRRYILWVESTLNGVWSSILEYSTAMREVNEHIENLNNIENPEFFVR